MRTVYARWLLESIDSGLQALAALCDRGYIPLSAGGV